MIEKSEFQNRVQFFFNIKNTKIVILVKKTKIRKKIVIVQR